MICDLCHRDMPDELSVLVDLDGKVTLICWRCDDKADPGLEGDDDAAG